MSLAKVYNAFMHQCVVDLFDNKNDRLKQVLIPRLNDQRVQVPPKKK